MPVCTQTGSADHGHVAAEAVRLGLDAADHRFNRRELREALHIGDTQLRVHLGRLVDTEYLVVHRGGQGRRFCYELVYNGEGQDGDRFVPGLAAPSEAATTPTSRGSEPDLAGQARGSSGPVAGQVRPPPKPRKPKRSKAPRPSEPQINPEEANREPESDAGRSRTDTGST